MAISVRGLIPEKSSHCSPLQPILTWQFQSGGGGNSWKVLPLQPIVGNSWKVFPLQPIAAHYYMAISVRGQFLKCPHFAINCSPLLHGNFSQGVNPEKFSLCSPLLVIPEKSFHWSPLQLTLTWQFKSGAIFEKSSLCNQLQPTLTWQFQSGGYSWKGLSLQPIAAHSYMAISVRGEGNSRKFLPLQPIAAHSYMAISVRGVIPQKSSIADHLSPLLHGNFSQEG